MHPDPDDTELQHDHFACRVPAWTVSNPIGRAYARRRVTRLVERELTEKGWTRTGPMCWHFGSVDGNAVVVVHFTVRDALATAYATDRADR